MKINRIIKLTVAMLAGVTLLAGCGSQSSSKNNTSTAQTQPKESQLELNGRGIVKAINKQHPRFKLEADADTGVITTAAEYDDYDLDSGKHKLITYGYTDNDKGISVVAFAVQNRLNRSQSDIIATMLDNAKDKDNEGMRDLSVNEGAKEYPMGRKKVRMDYLTVDSLRLTKGKKLALKGEATAHFYTGDGQPKQQKYTFNYLLSEEDGDGENKKLKQADIKAALHATHTNVQIPIERLGNVTLI